ncbi:MAG: aminoglycoside phosphotransferase-like protein [Actinomycetia bacterium]|nr:aminoglycoside phosphotransferase-like protein [Actinomycetes bacterium]
MSDAELDPGRPWRRELDSIGPALERWASNELGAAVTVSNVYAPDNGMSSETVLFDLASPVSNGVERYAARLAPLPELYPVFPEYELEMQARCMRLVRERTDVPAPDVRWVELDTQWLGSPFLVMRRIDGISPPDMPPYVFEGWLLEATDEQRASLQHGAVSTVARLHEITPDNADLSFLAHPEHGATPMRQQLGYQHWYYEWAREGVTFPLIERTFAWLEAHMPAEREPVLNWGDARIGNMLFADFEPVGVLDWEMATVGPREVDVAWMVFLHRFFQDLAQRFEISGLPEFMDRDEVATLYEKMSGHSLDALDWFEVYAALRFAIVSIRTSTRGIAYGTMEKPDEPDDMVMFRGMLERMLDGRP